jgi:hypothetical protein
MAGGRSQALPESARVKSGSMLDVPCELALEKMQALKCRLVDWHKGGQ